VTSNQTKAREMSWDIKPAVPAKLRCRVVVNMPENVAWNQVAQLRWVLGQLEGIAPDDAFVHIAYPYTHASWERPYTTDEVNELSRVRRVAHAASEVKPQ
jgi:hypothetical protein